MQLPYDRHCPVIYDNDTVIDVYTDEYLMALASAGSIQLRGILTSSSVAPYNRFVPTDDFESDAPVHPEQLNFVKNRAHTIRLARDSGFRNIPDPIVGIRGNLEKPNSGEIHDTQPHDTPGSRLIVETARTCTPEQPLVVVMGGPLSVAADAYLLDPAIADRMVIAWLGGDHRSMGDYNGACDWWAAYIAACRLRLVQFPNGQALPATPRARVAELPASPLRQWMIDKRHPHLPVHEVDGDAPPAVSIMRPDYVTATKQVSFSHMGENTGVDVPTEPIAYYQADPEGNVLIVTAADQAIGTEEWWRAITDPAIWNGEH